ncbi:TlpA family protein disulfide reductase [Streptomyces sp. LP05-1]|uniref:TlpA family protein disulfide reductase n=1 Tax=Streptomyces pyxinae TaxID=2970734 RepID=A0ABT2CIS6_9ACTN|nr:TlpA disulfide reductase family protein [Streptomyces sp. LP05-1]MCS0637319.1 TlpA family protein disulfide reductase [Streptomyces sp. LP05-1]
MIAEPPPRIPVRSRTTRRRWLRTAALAAGLTALAACTTGPGADGPADRAGAGAVTTVPAAERRPAPALTGESLHGERLDLAAYRGKVVVLNIWAAWCAPCRAEAPHFARVARELKNQGVEFVGINTRNQDTGEPLAFERDYGIPYPSFHDPSGKLILAFPRGSLNPQAIPTTLVVDREGRTAARALTALGEDQLKDMIRPLLTERPAPAPRAG